MDLSYIKNWLNPFVKKWWYKEEWKEADSGYAVEIVNVNGIGKGQPCSWDVKIHVWREYRHKSSCQTRLRHRGESFATKMNGATTVFEKPMTYCGEVRPELDELDFTEPYVDAEEG